MKHTKALLSVLAFALLGAFCHQAHAQGRVNKYTTTTFTATWSEISGTGTAFDFGGWQYSWFAGWSTASLTLPFAFNYDNTTVASGSNLTVSPDGAVGFGSTTSGYGGGLGNSSYPGLLCFLNGPALAIGDGNNGDNVNYY